MSTSPTMEYISAHPLAWSVGVGRSLKMEIIDAPGRLPKQRDLGPDISVNLSHLDAVGMSIVSPKYSGFGGFLQQCLDSVKTADGKLVDVTFSSDPMKLIRPTGPVLVPAGHFQYRGIPFLVYVTPRDVSHALWERQIYNEDNIDIVSYSMAALIALAQQAEKFLDQKRDEYPALVAYPTEDGKQIIVLSALVPTTYLENFQNGIVQTNTLEVTRTTITIGDGSGILEFAKAAVASALEPEKPDRPITQGKYRSWAKQRAAKEKKARITTTLRVA